MRELLRLDTPCNVKILPFDDLLWSSNLRRTAKQAAVLNIKCNFIEIVAVFVESIKLSETQLTKW